MASVQRFVYGIGSRGVPLVKIGWAIEPESRRHGLQKYSPVPLRVIWTAPGDVNVERALHRHFADRRQYSEWFDLGDIDHPAQLDAAMATIDAPDAPIIPGRFKIGHMREMSPDDLLRTLPRAAASRFDSHDARTYWELLVVEAHAAGISHQRIRDVAGTGPMDLGWIKGKYAVTLKSRVRVHRERVARGEQAMPVGPPGQGWRGGQAAHVRDA